MEQKNILIQGYGSIGKRHEQVAKSLGHKVSVLSRREGVGEYSSFTAVLEDSFDLIIITSETANHLSSLKELEKLGFKNTVLVEKPLFSEPGNYSPSFNVHVGYTLRFHPLIQRLKQEIANERCISAVFYVGQYLPSWRQGRDYQTIYSAKKDQGGGVTRDLSHELDLAHWFFGDLNNLQAKSEKISNLQIDCEDHSTSIGSYSLCPHVNIHLNYLDHIGQRFIIINTENKTFKLDLIQNTLQVNDEIDTISLERDQIYKDQLQASLSNSDPICTFLEGELVMKTIARLEKASL